MKVHELKTWRNFFMDVWNGKKMFELRKDDRNFQVGDKLILRNYNQLKGEYLPATIETEITYKLEGGAFGLESGFCILGLGYIEKKTNIPRVCEECEQTLSDKDFDFPENDVCTACMNMELN